MSVSNSGMGSSGSGGDDNDPRKFQWLSGKMTAPNFMKSARVVSGLVTELVNALANGTPINQDNVQRLFVC